MWPVGSQFIWLPLSPPILESAHAFKSRLPSLICNGFSGQKCESCFLFVKIVKTNYYIGWVMLLGTTVGNCVCVCVCVCARGEGAVTQKKPSSSFPVARWLSAMAVWPFPPESMLQRCWWVPWLLRGALSFPLHFLLLLETCEVWSNRALRNCKDTRCLDEPMCRAPSHTSCLQKALGLERSVPSFPTYTVLRTTPLPLQASDSSPVKRE